MPTKIQWAEETWNPVTGCSPVSSGCKNCYAKRMAQRLRGRFGYPKDDPFRVTFHPDRLDQPLRWHKPRRIFVCSMGDLFHDDVFKFKSSPFDSGLGCLLGSYVVYTDYPTLDAAFAVMERSPLHTFLLLTKRPGNMRRYFDEVQAHKMEYSDKFKDCPTKAMQNSPAAKSARHDAANPIPKHAWLGVTAENQKRADERIPVLLQIPAAKRFVSIEPMLGPVNLRKVLCNCPWFEDAEQTRHLMGCPLWNNKWPLDWVIVGGESGPGARPMNPDWARSIRDQCREAGVSFFMKQMSGRTAAERQRIPVDLQIRDWPL